MFGRTEATESKVKTPAKKNEMPEVPSSFLDPGIGYFRYLKLLGGFPVRVGVGCLEFSKWEYFRFATHLLFAFLSVNVFTCIGLILPKRNFFIYVDIFKVALSNYSFGTLILFLGSTIS